MHAMLGSAALLRCRLTMAPRPALQCGLPKPLFGLLSTLPCLTVHCFWRQRDLPAGGTPCKAGCGAAAEAGAQPGARCRCACEGGCVLRHLVGRFCSAAECEAVATW